MIDINKKYRTRNGCEVRIYATDGGGKYPIHGATKNEFGEWCVVGLWSHEGEIRIGYPSPADLVEVLPYEDFKIDDKVLVWCDHGGKEYKRYFAGVNDEGKPITFPDGVTSWSTGDWDKEVWDNYKRWCDE